MILMAYMPYISALSKIKNILFKTYLFRHSNAGDQKFFQNFRYSLELRSIVLVIVSKNSILQ